MRTTEKELIKEKGLKEYLRMRLASIKYSLQRGWSWIQTPAFATMFAGIMHPYVPSIPFWLLAVVGFFVIISVGFVDRQWRILHSENLYKSSKDPFLREILDKVEEINGKIKKMENEKRK